MNDDDERAQLRRRLRAMAAVNHHLRVQLDALEADQAIEEAPSAVRPELHPARRRAQIAADWMPDLLDAAPAARGADPVIVTHADRSVYLVEGPIRRRLTIGLLAPALEQLYGERRPIDDESFHALAEGAPIEVMEGPTGPPFVVIGGRRLALRGLGLAYGVEQTVVDSLPEGPLLDVAAAGVPRRSGTVAEWVGPLTDGPADPDAHLVAAPDGSVLVVDRGIGRLVRSGLLLPALEAALGERRPITPDERAALVEGPPVELLEGRSGLPFVVIGGRRLPVEGLPLPYPVERSPLDGLPEGPTIDAAAALVPRRANLASGWVPALTGSGGSGGSRPELVSRPDGAVYLCEAGRARRINSGLLVPALEQRLGARRPATEEEVEGWIEGPPLELLEGADGPPFLVIGGTRVPVHNLPVPHPVRASALDGLPEGPPIDVSAVQRAAFKALEAAEIEQADRRAKPDPTGELKALVDKKGVVRATAHLIKRKPDS